MVEAKKKHKKRSRHAYDKTEEVTRVRLPKDEQVFGVVDVTFTHTPLFWGQAISTDLFCKVLKVDCKAGELDFTTLFFRGFRINWLIVGIKYFLKFL